MEKTVTVLSLGGQPQVLTGNYATVRDVVEELGLESNLSVKLNGDAGDYDTELPQFCTLVFGEKVKGGNEALYNTWEYATEDLLTHWSYVG